MLYCIWNIQFDVLCCIVFGTYRLVLYVVFYLKHTVWFYMFIVFETYSLVLHVVLYLEHAV